MLVAATSRKEEEGHKTMSQGRFVWYSLNTTDPARSIAFFTGLFPWKINPIDMGGGVVYQQIERDGNGFAGVRPFDSVNGGQSHWIAYIAVDDVDAASAQIAQEGGTIVAPPADIPTIGRYSVATDPQGAYFMTFHPTGMGDMPEATPPTPDGAVSWNELVTNDVNDAVRFYGKIFGWTAKPMPMGDFVYTIMERNKRPECGIFAKPPQVPMSAWTVYFETKDIDWALKKTTETGGQILMPVNEVQGVGRFAVGADPTGAVFGLLQSAPM
jgi:uncharacterized protein